MTPQSWLMTSILTVVWKQGLITAECGGHYRESQVLGASCMTSDNSLNLSVPQEDDIPTSWHLAQTKEGKVG